jgi:hypothetical protein
MEERCRSGGNKQFGGFGGCQRTRRSRGEGVRHRLSRPCAGGWRILAGADAAAKDLNGKVKVRVTGPTTFDPQRQAQNVSRRARDQAGRFDRSQRSATALYATGFGGAVERRPRGVDQRSADA